MIKSYLRRDWILFLGEIWTYLHSHVVAVTWSVEEGAVGGEHLRLMESRVGDGY